MSVLSTWDEYFLNWTYVISMFRLNLLNLPSEILIAHFTFLFGWNFDKSLISEISNIGEKKWDGSE